MPGSLIIGDYDVLARGGPVTMSWDGGRNFGDPVPDVQTVARILLDGDVVSGARSGNREIVLKLLIKRTAVAQAAVIRANLFRTVNQQQWTMQWTPAPGMTPVLFDCYRGSMSRAWEETYDGVLDVLVLTIPALPFTRDATVTVLTPPTESSTLAVLDDMSGTGTTVPAGLSTAFHRDDVPKVLREPMNGNGTVFELPGAPLDYPGPVLAVDEASFIAGGSSRTVTQQVITIGAIVPDSAGAYTWAETAFAPLTIAGDLAEAVDLSDAASVSWWARTSDATTTPTGAGSTLTGDPLTVGIAWGQDDESLRLLINDGTWVLTLTDSSDRSASWVVHNKPGSLFAQVRADLTTPAWSEDGFDLSAVAAYRLRLYRIDATVPLTEGATSELYPSDSTGGVIAQNVVGGSATSIQTNETTYFNNRYSNIQSTAADSQWSHPVSVPVTAGQMYSATCVIYSGSGTSTDYYCGIEWLDVNNAVLSTSWGSAAAIAQYVHDDKSSWQTDGTLHIVKFAAHPTLAAAVAPANAVKARIRYRVTGAGGSQAFYGTGPHLNAGATPQQWPYANGMIVHGGGLPAAPGNPVTTLWVDELVANRGQAGISLTKPYGTGRFPPVGGVARCPVSLDVAASAGCAWMLIARTPDPRPGFLPVLDSPTSSGNTVDATTLTGVHQSTQTQHVVYTLPAASYSGTYAVFARVKFPSTSYTLTLNIAQGGTTFDTLTAKTVTANQWEWVLFGAVELPPRAVADTNLDTFTLDLYAAGAAVLTDVMVLVDLAGEVIVVDGATLPGAVKPTRLWIDSPDSDKFTGVAYIGTEDDRSDAISAAQWQSGQAVFQFEPDQDNALTVIADAGASNTTVQVGMQYARRWAGETDDSDTM